MHKQVQTQSIVEADKVCCVNCFRRLVVDFVPRCWVVLRHFTSLLPRLYRVQHFTPFGRNLCLPKSSCLPYTLKFSRWINFHVFCELVKTKLRKIISNWSENEACTYSRKLKPRHFAESAFSWFRGNKILAKISRYTVSGILVTFTRNLWLQYTSWCKFVSHKPPAYTHLLDSQLYYVTR